MPINSTNIRLDLLDFETINVDFSRLDVLEISSNILLDNQPSFTTFSVTIGDKKGVFSLLLQVVNKLHITTNTHTVKNIINPDIKYLNTLACKEVLEFNLVSKFLGDDTNLQILGASNLPS